MKRTIILTALFMFIFCSFTSAAYVLNIDFDNATNYTDAGASCIFGDCTAFNITTDWVFSNNASLVSGHSGQNERIEWDVVDAEYSGEVTFRPIDGAADEFISLRIVDGGTICYQGVREDQAACVNKFCYYHGGVWTGFGTFDDEAHVLAFTVNATGLYLWDNDTSIVNGSCGISQIDSIQLSVDDADGLAYWDDLQLWTGSQADKPASPSPEMSISLTYPANETSYYGDYNGSLLVTLAGVNGSATCSINDSRFTLNTSSPFGNGTINYYEGDPFTENNISVYINCTDNAKSVELPFWFYLETSLEIDFYDENTNTQLNGTNVTLSLVGSDNSTFNYSTNTSQLSFSALQFTNYTLTYTSSGYSTRNYPLEVEETGNYTLTLYLINSSLISNILLNLYDSVGSELEGYNIRVLRLIDGAYPLVEIATTNYNGQGDISAVTYTPYYKFIIEKDGVIYQETDATEIYDTTLNFWINLESDYTESYRHLIEVDYDFYYTEANSTFTVTYNDPSSELSEFCMRVYSQSYYGAQTLSNESCLTTPTGTIDIHVPRINGTTYTAQLYASFSPEQYIEQLIKEFINNPSIGKIGLFLTFLIVAGFIVVGYWTPVFSLVMIPISLWLTKLVGFHSYSGGVLTGLTALCFIFAFLIWRFK